MVNPAFDFLPVKWDFTDTHPRLEVAFSSHDLTDRILIIEPLRRVFLIAFRVVALRDPAIALAVLMGKPIFLTVLEVFANRGAR